MDAWVHGWRKEGEKDELMGGWMDRWTDGWIDSTNIYWVPTRPKPCCKLWGHNGKENRHDPVLWELTVWGNFIHRDSLKEHACAALRGW